MAIKIIFSFFNNYCQTNDIKESEAIRKAILKLKY